jgi:hypothetical protein
MNDVWEQRKQFEKSGKFITRDWTKHTLSIDLQNSLGEKFHFDVEPEADAKSVSGKSNMGVTDGIILHLLMPIATGE